MRRLQYVLLTAFYAAGVGLANYEVLSHAQEVLGVALPCSWEARRVDREVRYRRLTRLPAVDRVLHEGAEAATFYEDLLR